MNTPKRFLIVAQERGKKSNPSVELVHAIEWYGYVEELEQAFNEVFGRGYKINEIMQTVRHSPVKGFKTPFREWLTM